MKNKNLVIGLVVLIIIIFVIIFINANTNYEQINNIADSEPPELIINGDDKKIVALGTNNLKDSATAIDNIDGDITDKISVEGNVDTNNIGTYELIYRVTDNAGNTTKKKQEIIVCNPLGEEGLPVLMYHFFYDETKEQGKDNNWIEISDFEEQIKYLSENNFYFPTWEEVEEYIDGKTILPEKSIVLTFDDGDASFFELAVPVLQKYNIDGTSFVITSWYGYRAQEKQANVNYESHSDNMHQGGSNGKGVMLSWDYDKIVEDLNKSKEILGSNATIFCYPFGQYNETSIEALKETGYKLSFTTEAGRVKVGSNKYALPRVRISKTTTLSQFKTMVN